MNLVYLKAFLPSVDVVPFFNKSKEDSILHIIGLEYLRKHACIYEKGERRKTL